MDSQQIGENSPFSLSLQLLSLRSSRLFAINRAKQNGELFQMLLCIRWWDAGIRLMRNVLFLKIEFVHFDFTFLIFVVVVDSNFRSFFSVFSCGNIWILRLLFPYRRHRFQHDEASSGHFLDEIRCARFQWVKNRKSIYRKGERDFFPRFFVQMNLIDEFSSLLFLIAVWVIGSPIRLLLFIEFTVILFLEKRFQYRIYSCQCWWESLTGWTAAIVDIIFINRQPRVS